MRDMDLVNECRQVLDLLPSLERLVLHLEVEARPRFGLEQVFEHLGRRQTLAANLTHLELSAGPHCAWITATKWLAAQLLTLPSLVDLPLTNFPLDSPTGVGTKLLHLTHLTVSSTRPLRHPLGVLPSFLKKTLSTLRSLRLTLSDSLLVEILKFLRHSSELPFSDLPIFPSPSSTQYALGGSPARDGPPSSKLPPPPRSHPPLAPFPPFPLPRPPSRPILRRRTNPAPLREGLEQRAGGAGGAYAGL